VDPAAPEVHVDLKTLHRSGAGSITAGVWFDFDGPSFPSAGWSDFVVVILGWWIQALRSNDRSCRLQFMDGPYSLRVNRKPGGRATVDCTRDDLAGEKILFSCEVDFLKLREAVSSAGRSVSEACRAMKWESSDILGLARVIEES